MIGACIIGLHLATYHFDRNAGFNDVTPGAYVSCDDWVAGAYRNSNNGHSQYIGRAFHIGPVDLVTGVIAGYSRGPMPMLLPSIKVSDHIRLTLIPPIPKATVNTAGIHLSVEF
jgi:hypothetical protein